MILFTLFLALVALALWNIHLRQRMTTNTQALQRALAQGQQAGQASEAARDHLEQEVARRTAALAAANEEQQALFDAATTGIVLLKERMIVRCNRRMDALFGYAPGEQLGRCTRIWYPDDATFEAVGREVYAQIRHGGTDRRGQEVVRKDGSRFWVRMTGHAIDAADLAKGMVGIIEDITESRRLEEELRTSQERLALAMEASTDGLWDWNIKTGETYYTPAYFRMLGYDPADFADRTVNYWIELVHPQDRAATVAMAQRQLVGPGHYELEFRMRTKDGGYKWILSRGKVVSRDEQGQPTRAVGTHTDMTTRKMHELELREAQALAEEAARIKADFLANMSHEIRTPMNAITVTTHLLLKTELSARQRDSLQQIQTSSRHLLSIINDILDVSKIESGKLPIEHSAFDLTRVLADVVGLIAEKAVKKGLELIIDIADAVPHQLVGDPLRLGQILSNYADNAVKFTERGKITIAATLAQATAQEVVLRFAVHDTGIGLREDQRRRLFQNFQQADSSTTRKYGGSGLGLVIAKRLAELMGGAVGVESTPGVGSTFWFTVRLGRGQAAPQTAAAAGARIRPPETPAAATPGEPIAIDEERLGAVCARLASALAADEFAAGDLLNEHAALLQAGLGEDFTRIAAAIGDFDFAAALDVLKAATARRRSAPP